MTRRETRRTSRRVSDKAAREVSGDHEKLTGNVQVPAKSPATDPGLFRLGDGEGGPGEYRALGRVRDVPAGDVTTTRVQPNTVHSGATTAPVVDQPSSWTDRSRKGMNRASQAMASDEYAAGETPIRRRPERDTRTVHAHETDPRENQIKALIALAERDTFIRRCLQGLEGQAKLIQYRNLAAAGELGDEYLKLI